MTWLRPAILFGFLSAVVATENQQHTAQDVLQKFATPCTTPNNDLGVCVEVQKCSVFMDALSSGQNDNFEFIRESRCGPVNENKGQPKVCCGYHANYLYRTTTTTKRPKKTNINPFPTVCGNHTIMTPSRIFGGTRASLGEFPWMARLRHRRSDGVYSYGCAGFLISKYFVLTAAHCVRSAALEPMGPLYQVQLGEHNTEIDPDCEASPGRRHCADSPQLLRIAKPKVHPEYSNNIHQHNDIAVIPLREPAKLTEYVYPICLAKTHSQQSEMWLSGWGSTEMRENSPIKLKVSVERVSRNECADIYNTAGVRILPTQLCAGGEAGRDSCSGDSGGPIMVQTGLDPWYAEGIVSFGMGCGLEGWPGIYTNIPSYLPWIKKVTKRYLRDHVENESGMEQ